MLPLLGCSNSSSPRHCLALLRRPRWCSRIACHRSSCTRCVRSTRGSSAIKAGVGASWRRNSHGQTWRLWARRRAQRRPVRSTERLISAMQPVVALVVNGADHSSTGESEWPSHAVGQRTDRPRGETRPFPRACSEPHRWRQSREAVVTCNAARCVARSVLPAACRMSHVACRSDRPWRDLADQVRRAQWRVPCTPR